MNFKSKKISLVILGVTAFVCSGVMFRLFDDPEGPNLLVVTVMAAILYFLSLAVYVFDSPISDTKKLRLALSVQLLVVTFAYFFLR
jgi:hypothetical protein